VEHACNPARGRLRKEDLKFETKKGRKGGREGGREEENSFQNLLKVVLANRSAQP
jgi:hypothetical protein